MSAAGMQARLIGRDVARLALDEPRWSNNPELARALIEQGRWPCGPMCPFCDGLTRITPRRGGFYRCNACVVDFTVRTGLVFERSKVSLDKWLLAIVQCTLRGPSRVNQIETSVMAHMIGSSPATARLMLRKLRAANIGELRMISGWVTKKYYAEEGNVT